MLTCILMPSSTRLTVTTAIGDDKEHIERIYGDSFLDITDLNKLPVALINVIKRYMRV